MGAFEGIKRFFSSSSRTSIHHANVKKLDQETQIALSSLNETIPANSEIRQKNIPAFTRKVDVQNGLYHASILAKNNLLPEEATIQRSDRSAKIFYKNNLIAEEHYDSQGRINRYTTYTYREEKGKKTVVQTKKAYEYKGDKSEIIQQVTYVKEGWNIQDGFSLDERTRTIQFKDNKPAQEIRHARSSETIIQYDESGLKSLEEKYSLKPNRAISEKREYEKGQLKVETSFKYNLGALEEEQETLYDQAGQPSPTRIYDISFGENGEKVRTLRR